MCFLHIQGDLTSVKVAAEVFGTGKYLLYWKVARVLVNQSFEKGRGDRTCTSPMEEEFPVELEHPFKDPKLWKLQKLYTYGKLGSEDL